MSLDDIFNPNDGSLIDRIDNCFLELNKKIAKKWQDKTYRNKDDLATGLYFCSSVVLLGNIINNLSITSIYLTIPLVDNLLKSSIKSIRAKSNLDEEIKLELLNVPRKTMKYINTMMYCLSTISIGAAIFDFINGNDELYRSSINNLTFGLGFLSLTSANYISKADLGEPPTKPKKKPIYQRIREGITNLIPKPAYQRFPR